MGSTVRRGVPVHRESNAIQCQESVCVPLDGLVSGVIKVRKL